MDLDRRHLLSASGALLASCVGGPRAPKAHEHAPLDLVLDAHARVHPERAGAGANHYPMAAETLEALGRTDRIELAWCAAAASYGAALPRARPIEDVDAALGDFSRHAEWLETFRVELAREPWRAVVARWVPLLAPAVGSAIFHGVIRTAHAVRALRRAPSAARELELAAALAYWAARSTALPVSDSAPELRAPLARLTHRRVAPIHDVPFDDVDPILARLDCVPRVPFEGLGDSPAAELDALVRESAELFLEMLVQERHRIWLLHGITGPAAAALLVPELDDAGARSLAAHSRQAVTALFLALGAPCTPRAHLRDAIVPWDEHLRAAAESGSVHTIKLVEALHRHRHVDDALCRSVAAQWFEWE